MNPLFERLRALWRPKPTPPPTLAQQLGNPYHRRYTPTRSFSELVPGAKKEE